MPWSYLKRNCSRTIICSNTSGAVTVTTLTNVWLCHSLRRIFGQRIKDVPSDPYLPYLFDGEEISMGVRLWTHGWDMFVPDRDIVYHIYSMKMEKGSEKRHLFWELSIKDKYRKYAEFRILKLLKLFEMYVPNLTQYSIDLREFDKYALGTGIWVIFGTGLGWILTRENRGIWEYANLEIGAGKDPNQDWVVASFGQQKLSV